ncbi:hypothetical protein SH139x_004511 [Planctomycetaceae bacterium SH139]
MMKICRQPSGLPGPIAWFLTLIVTSGTPCCAQTDSPDAVRPPDQPAAPSLSAGPLLQGPQLLAPPLQTEPLIGATEGGPPEKFMPEATSRGLLNFITNLLREQIPETYVEDKDWNKTKEVYAGVRIQRDGLKLKTKRRWKEVNHGLWRRYHAQLVNPDQTLELTLSDVYWQPDGRLHLRLRASSTFDVTARQARWNLDVRLYSLHVLARCRMAVDVEAVIGFQVQPVEVPPAIQLAPEVLTATLSLEDFEVDEVGHLGSDIAEELGKAAEDLVLDKVIKSQSRKLADKLNRQLEKKQEKLRFSLSDWLAELLTTGSLKASAKTEN